MGPNSMHSSPSDELESEVRRLRRLARGLLYDQHASEDVVQEAWLTAMRSSRPPRSVSLGAWLAGIVKKLASQRKREQARRARREQLAARPESIEATDESSARLELSRRMFVALDELDEPYRTVIALRFLDGLPPREIAARLKQPVNTVRTQIRRGLERLRAQLDVEGQAGQANLLAALVPLAGPVPWGRLLPGPAGSTSLGPIKYWTSALFMSNKLIAIAAAALIIAFSTGLFSPTEEAALSQPEPLAKTDVALVPQVPTIEQGLLASESELQPSRFAENPEREALSTWTLAGTVRGADDKPMTGLPVRIRMHSGYDDRAPLLREGTVTSDRQGHFAWSTEAPEHSVYIVASGVGTHIRSLEAEARIFAGEAAPDDLQVRVMPLDITIVGRVIDAEGRPIAGAEVQAYERTAHTDEAGRYELPSSSQRNSTQLRVQAHGYARQQTFVTLYKTGKLRAADIVLVPEFLLRGHVVDAAGAPIEGALITSEIFDPLETVSDAEGAFALGGYDPSKDRYHLYVNASGYAETILHPRASECREGLLVLLTAAGSLRGRVVDEQGQPVEAAFVCIGNPPSVYPQVNSWSDTNGAFEFHGLKLETLPFWITRSGFSPTDGTLLPQAGALGDPLLLVLRRGHEIGGRLFGADRKPLAGATVYGERGDLDSSDGVVPSVHTDDEGHFLLSDLENANYRIGFSKQGYARLEVEDVQIDSKNNIHHMLPAGTIKGRVLDGLSGEPISSFRIRFVDPLLEEGEERLWGYSSKWGKGMDFVDTQGHFDCYAEELDAGPVIGIEVSAKGYALGLHPHVVSLPASEAEEVTIRLFRGSSVQGRVLDAATGRPISGARILRITERVPLSEATRDWIEVLKTTTNAEGEFEMKDLPPGSMSLVALHEDWCFTQSGPLNVAHHASLPYLELRMGAGASLRVQVQASDGTPLPNAGVALYPMDREAHAQHEWRARTDGEGRALFEHLSAGEYQVSWTQTSGNTTVNLLTESVNVELVGTTEVDLRARGSGTVTGRVTFANGQDLPSELVVTLAPIDASKEAGHPTRSVFTSAGSFEIQAVEPGSYRISSYHYGGDRRGFSRDSQAIEVPAKGFVDAQLSLEQQP